METHKTLRAGALYYGNSGREAVFVGPIMDGDVPVLVVPEAAVKGCRHPNADRGISSPWCGRCGALYNYRTHRWQRPRVLQVAR